MILSKCSFILEFNLFNIFHSFQMDLVLYNKLYKKCNPQLDGKSMEACFDHFITHNCEIATLLYNSQL